jgi:6-phosphogluconolactonase (cycloisomerase 2 family)
MSTHKRTFGLAFLCLILLAGSATCFASATQLLYVQCGQLLVTYSINPTTAVATKLGSLWMNASLGFPIQIFHSGSYVYILGFTSSANAYFWVHATTPAGVPTENPIQKLAVNNSINNFVFHPNGLFGYAVNSRIDANFNYVGDVMLYTVNPKTGFLTSTKEPVAHFSPSHSWVPNLYGLNSTGTKLYVRAFGDTNGNDFYDYPINTKTGLLGSPVYFWHDVGDPYGFVSTIISDQFIALEFDFFAGPVGIRIYANRVYPAGQNPTPIIDCDAAMVAACGDGFGDGSVTQINPSGKYLFIDDQVIGNVIVAAVDTKNQRLEETASSIPGNPQILSFSPDGNLVYAAENAEILVYLFDPSAGVFTANSSFNVPSYVASIVPAAGP